MTETISTTAPYGTGNVNPVDFGAQCSWDIADVATNTAAVQSALDTLATTGGTIQIPGGVWYDWTALTYPDFITIVDDSGYDAMNLTVPETVPEQSYRRYIHKSGEDSQDTNTASHWLTSLDRHPAYVTHFMGEIGTTGAKGSMVNWIGNQERPLAYAAQWAFDYTDASRPLVVIAGYDRTPTSLTGSTRLFTVVHSADHTDSGAWGNTVPRANASYDLVQSGLSGSDSYTTKGFLGFRSLPAQSTGQFDERWLRGSENLFIRRIRATTKEVSSYYFGNAYASYQGNKKEVFSDAVITTDPDGSQYGALDKYTAMPALGTSLGAFHSNSFYHNGDFTGGLIKNLPEAKQGIKLTIDIIEPQNVRVQTSGTDVFAGRSLGDWMQSYTVGSSIHLRCPRDGIWMFERTGTWIDG